MQTLMRNILISMFIVVIILSLHFKPRNKKVFSLYTLGVLLFSLSMVFVFSLTGVSPMSGFHLDIKISEISLIPFKGILEMLQDGITTHSFINIIGNIIMFMPVGFLIPLLCSKFDNYKKAITIGFFISLLIEFSQLFLVRGTDIDDLILNTFGTFLGYLVFIGFKKIFKNLTEKFTLSSKTIKHKLILLSGVLIPYITIVTLGFYDRFMF